MKWYENLYYFLLGITYILYFVLFLTGWNQAPQYLTQINLITQVFVGFLLLWFFHPLQNYKFSPFHQTIAFTAGFFLIYSTILTKLMEYVQEWTKPYHNSAIEGLRKAIAYIQS